MYAHVAVVVAVAAVVVAVAAVVVAVDVAAATVVDAGVYVAAGPADAAVVVAAAAAVSLGDSRERWDQSAVVLAVAECLALCYSELWTVVAAPLLTTLTR